MDVMVNMMLNGWDYMDVDEMFTDMMIWWWWWIKTHNIYLEYIIKLVKLCSYDVKNFSLKNSKVYE